MSHASASYKRDHVVKVLRDLGFEYEGKKRGHPSYTLRGATVSLPSLGGRASGHNAVDSGWLSSGIYPTLERAGICSRGEFRERLMRAGRRGAPPKVERVPGVAVAPLPVVQEGGVRIPGDTPVETQPPPDSGPEPELPEIPKRDPMEVMVERLVHARVAEIVTELPELLGLKALVRDEVRAVLRAVRLNVEE